MTEIAIKRQIADIKKVSKEVQKTKSAATKFLIEAGIIRKSQFTLKRASTKKK